MQYSWSQNGEQEIMIQYFLITAAIVWDSVKKFKVKRMNMRHLQENEKWEW